MDNLKVCLINDSFPPAIDGVANAVTNYAKIIAEEYGTPTVVTPFYPNAEDSVFKFPVIRYPSVDMTKLVGYRAGLPFSPEITNRLERTAFDIIHSHCPITSTILARSVRERMNVPVVFTYHTKFDIDIANAIRSKLLQGEAAKLLVENISACDEVWTVSRGAGENLRKLGYQGEYLVMPNGVDFPQGRVSDELIDRVTAGYDLPEGVPVFLFVGRMMWYKGIRITLDALKQLQETDTDFRMVFVGGGIDQKEIRAYTASLGLDGKVFFVEPIHDRDCIRAWYCRADLFLFPSTIDTHGLVVREAAACALASVLVEGSCAAEDVADGKSGFLIQENAESMAACLRELCAQKERMREVGEEAQRDIYISWREAVRSAVERYRVVIDNYRSGRYPKHAGVRDELLSGIGTLMSGIGDGEARRQELLERLKTGADEKRSFPEWFRRFDSGVTELFLDPMRENLKTRMAEWSDEAERRKEAVNRSLEEYFDIFL